MKKEKKESSSPGGDEQKGEVADSKEVLQKKSNGSSEPKDVSAYIIGWGHKGV